MVTQIQKHMALLGKRIEDKVTGAQGVASSISFDLYGCVQVVITPVVGKDGKVNNGTWFDVNRIFIVDSTPVMKVPDFEDGPVAEGDRGCADKPDQ